MFPTQVLLPGGLWSGIILWDLCLVALPYLLLAGISANVEEQVKRILIKTDIAQTLSSKCKTYLLKIYLQQGNFFNTI